MAKPPQDVFPNPPPADPPLRGSTKPVVTITLNIPEGVELDLNINGDDVFLGTSDHE